MPLSFRTVVTVLVVCTLVSNNLHAEHVIDAHIGAIGGIDALRR